MNKSGKRDWLRRNIGGFLRQYQRKSQRGVEPNDRQYDRKMEQELLRMRPEDLSDLINDAEDPSSDLHPHCYWFPVPGQLGIGVTALGLKDAHKLATAAADRLGWTLGGDVVVDVDPGALDQGHVVPNMDLMLRRGVWFPLGAGDKC